MLICLAAWQLLQLWALAATPIAFPWALAASHVLIIGLALLARRGAFAPGLLIVIVYAVSVWDWAVAAEQNSVLAFATAWLVNLTGIATTFIVAGRRAIVLTVSAAALVPIALNVVNPGWGWGTPSAVFVTQLAILAATRIGLSVLLIFSRRADDAHDESERETHRAAILNATRQKVAEDTRALHDSVINTLGAIAEGGAATADVVLVREQCAHDLAVVSGLRAARHDQPAQGLLDVLDRSPISIVRTGMTDSDVIALEQQLGPSKSQLIAGAVQELLRNASKHSGASSATIDLARNGSSYIVTVSDEGVGFDARIGSKRGFHTSVEQRVAELDASLVLDTSVGLGTTVVVQIPIDGPPLAEDLAPASMDDFARLASELQIRAGWAWALAIGALGLVLEVVNRRGEFTETYLMLGCVLVATGAAWLGARRPRWRWPVYLVLIFSASGAFILSAAAVDFGQSHVLLWQSLAPAAPLVLLLSLRPLRAILWAGLVVYGLTVTVLTIGEWQYSPTAAAVIPISGLVGLGFVAAWASFQRTVVSIGAHAASDTLATFTLKLNSDLRDAAQQVQQRWVAAGLENALEILSAIADGKADPRATSVRSRCGVEERYLRQMLGFDARLVNLGYWFTRAINESRQRELTLTIRTGGDDLSRDEAATVGRLVTSVIAQASAGSTLTCTLFTTSRGAQFTLVAPHPSVAEVYRTEHFTGPEAQLHHLGDLDVMELTLRPLPD